ncbi:hypothetical protein EUGRSUZ_F01491 [Eucalyptus grandis]|uniref:Uncharacterized protein n=2 Tax=Eucalyptus grandis TaxID=71139 RepID=A0A059BPD1_EUCGR|nr:hypothetical protein EUGRSUZ_F01491 [Eucalyptus grandis]
MGLVQVAATGGQGGATKASGASRGQQAGVRLARFAARAEDVGLRVVGVGGRRRRVAADIGEGLHEEDEQFLFLSSSFFFYLTSLPTSPLADFSFFLFFVLQSEKKRSCHPLTKENVSTAASL